MGLVPGNRFVSLGGGARARAWFAWRLSVDVLVTRTSLYGNGPPMLFARADETAPKMAPTAEKAARMTDRNFLNRRWGMPGSFQGRGADSAGTVCSGHADVNYC